MLRPEIEKILNRQVQIESQASFKYLALAVWCDQKGFSGAATFLYEHADEERMHMLKLIKFVTDRGGKVTVPAVEKPRSEFEGIRELFQYAYDGEQKVTEAVGEIVALSQKLGDHTTHNFMQWYVGEQLEEENLYRQILDRIDLIGDSGNALYLIDVEIGRLSKGAGGMAVVDDQE